MPPGFKRVLALPGELWLVCIGCAHGDRQRQIPKIQTMDQIQSSVRVAASQLWRRPRRVGVASRVASRVHRPAGAVRGLAAFAQNGTGKIWHNGALVPWESANVHVLTTAVQVRCLYGGLDLETLVRRQLSPH